MNPLKFLTAVIRSRCLFSIHQVVVVAMFSNLNPGALKIWHYVNSMLALWINGADSSVCFCRHTEKRMKPVYVIGLKTVYANSQGWTRTQKLMIFCQQNNCHSMLKKKGCPFTYNISNNDAHS